MGKSTYDWRKGTQQILEAEEEEAPAAGLAKPAKSRQTWR